MMQKRVYFSSRQQFAPVVLAVDVADLRLLNGSQWVRIALAQYRSWRRESRQNAKVLV